MEEIYLNVEYEKSQVSSRPSRSHTGPRRSESRSHGAVVLSLGLLSVFLLAGLIGLFVHYHNSVGGSAADLSTIKANLTERLQASEDKLSSVSEERDLLNTNLTNLIEEMDRLHCWCKQKKTCPEGWRMFNRSCYLLSTRSDSWETGRKDCRDKGTDLVIIDSLEEQKFILSIVTHRSWIGLSDRDDEGSWKWVDGTPLTEAYWNLNEPNNGGGDPQFGEEDCVEILVDRKTEGNWNDVRCGYSRKWICENLA
ncbi:C-type lectin domain family 4 member E-like [Cebidichthys violaceus]|uniref:C-type lectin domain family 4 member E-like n=1 Tax=Cebidichthys violaceus TaxID=271503 RepID=UPI0035CBFEBA